MHGTTLHNVSLLVPSGVTEVSESRAWERK
jgi:hypothetical protein